MCGIAGVLDIKRATFGEELSRIATGMASRLAHRGPDASASWTDAPHGIALGFRRLAVRELSPLGAQPMISSCGRYVLVFNGEIYNDDELRVQLTSCGRTFRGHSDTEVLAEGISAWGILATLARIDAMFALAVWDRQECRLTLARDRFGEKPLYYGRLGSHVVFGSELRVFRAHPRFRPQLDPIARDLFLSYGHVPAPHAALTGIQKLPPATVASVDRDGTWHQETYWSAASVAAEAAVRPRSVDAHQAQEELERLLVRSVRSRSRSDAPLGAFLSGGIDSSCIVALAQAASARPLRTYTIGFGAGSHDEAAFARAVANFLGTQHTEHYVTDSEIIELAPAMSTVYDEPFADSSQLPMTLVSHLARKDVTVALSGDGADEVFGGYNRHLAQHKMGRFASMMPEWIRRASGRGLSLVSEPAWDRVAHLWPRGKRPRHLAEKMSKLAQGLSAKDLAELHRALLTVPGLAVAGGARLQPPASLAAVATPAELLMWLDTVSYLPDDILTKVDRASMSVGLEARMPYLAPALFQFAWSLPVDLKFRDGRGKWLLRQVLYGHVPQSLIERPKTGFAAPVGLWLRGPLRPWATELLTEPTLAHECGLSLTVTRRIWSQHLNGSADRSRELWPALSLLNWVASGAIRPADMTG